MKNFIASVIIIIGIFLLITSFTMDTSVEVDYQNGNTFGLPDRVNNLGLMQDKQNYMMIGAVLVLGGLIIGFVGSGSKINTSDTFNTKKCPKCAENIKEEAKICRYCNYQFETKNAKIEKEDMVDDDTMEAIRKNLQSGKFI